MQSYEKLLSLQVITSIKMKKVFYSLFVITVLSLTMVSCCGEQENQNVEKMNTTMEDLMTRRSIRSYTDEMPPMEVIEEICKAGTYTTNIAFRH